MKKAVKVKALGFYDNRSTEKGLCELLCQRYNVEISDSPEYLFYSCVDEDAWMNYDCIRIFNSSEMITPNFNFCDYAIGHDDIEFGDRYLRMPAWLAHVDMNNIYAKTDFDAEKLLKKDRFCNFIYGNWKKGCENREMLYRYISEQYKKVDSAGKYLHEVDMPNVYDDWARNKVEFMRGYKFSIAGENGAHDGYITEKIMNAFEAQTIPIYLGAHNVTNELNPNAFINCSDYPDFEAVLDKIREIDNNDELYIEMMRQPVFNQGIDPEEYWARKNDFLFHIFDQEYDMAFRRNRTYWGYKIESEAREEKKEVIKYRRNIFNRFIFFMRRILLHFHLIKQSQY